LSGVQRKTVVAPPVSVAANSMPVDLPVGGSNRDSLWALSSGESEVLVRSIGVGAAGCGRRTLRSNSTSGVNGITSQPFGPHRLQAPR
jgi:hypothetical protein